MIKKLVFFPSDPITAYLDKGKTYAQLEEYYNPGDFFDEVFCLSPWGKNERIGKINYINANPIQFKKIIKKIRPCVVRGYGGYCCADWVSISKVKNIPFVVSVHDTNPSLIHDSLKYADAIICMSSAVKDAVINKLGTNHSNIFIMGNRVDVNLFSKKNDIEFVNKLNEKYGYCKHILHVGRKCEQKNIETVIESLKYLSDNYNAIFIGKGNTEQYIKVAKKFHVENRCFFEQGVLNNTLPIYYSWCDCLCVPSRWEGFGVVFIEAAACETFIVTSNIAPMNEFLTNEIDAILVNDYENPIALANAIKLNETDPDKVELIRHAARNVGLKFKKEIIDKQEIEIYKQVLSLKTNKECNTDLRHQLKKQNLKSFVLKIRNKMKVVFK